MAVLEDAPLAEDVPAPEPLRRRCPFPTDRSRPGATDGRPGGVSFAPAHPGAPPQASHRRVVVWVLL